MHRGRQFSEQAVRSRWRGLPPARGQSDNAFRLPIQLGFKRRRIMRRQLPLFPLIGLSAVVLLVLRRAKTYLKDREWRR
jgi:hypothetical protein